MKVLQVIHGYPMRYNAGSEVYTQTLSHGLAERHEVHVFTREEDAFAPDFRLRTERDDDDARITVHVVNNPRLRDSYRAAGIDERFAEVLNRVKPDVVHVGHLNHLSTSLLREAALREVPIVFTLHDYWLMCPRGQFMQMFPEDPENLWAACDGQEDGKCAERCYARYFSGAPDEREADVEYWTGWVARRMRHVRQMAELVDLFIAPARYLHARYRDSFGVPESKIVHLDYGFARKRMSGRHRTPGEPFTFGYIGTHIPAKGIHDLLRAFGRLRGNARLRIWGRTRGQETDALKMIAAALPFRQSRPPRLDANLEWGGLPRAERDLSKPRPLRRLQHAEACGERCLNWTELVIAPDGSHHTLGTGEPAYRERFTEVLRFHAPGLAPVRCGTEAWHIRPDGSAAYTRRFLRTFGYYEARAAVAGSSGWHHVTADGQDAYSARFEWCGNFQGLRCAVREIGGAYLHIHGDGRPAYAERWRYAGDYRDGIAVVQGDGGRSTHVDLHGGLVHARWFVDLDVFHKAFARARDEDGWTHVDLTGTPTYRRRFASVEPFYNGQARVERFDGALEVIDEAGVTIVELRQARTSSGSRDLAR